MKFYISKHFVYLNSHFLKYNLTVPKIPSMLEMAKIINLKALSNFMKISPDSLHHYIVRHPIMYEG
jgi:hypothetical protein